MKIPVGLSVLVVIAGCAGIRQTSSNKPPPTGPPWMDPALPPRMRAEFLVQRMTLDEKISQIHMMDEKEHPREVGGIAHLGIPTFKITNGPAGAGPGDARPTQPGTALPAAIGLAASWDPELARTFGGVAGQEVFDRGENLLEGPGVNMTRVPQNGRNFEYFGEDPFLSAQMGVAEIEGIQQHRVIAEVKHFACNNQETNRKTINEIVDERTMREIYLPAFEACVKEADPGAAMAAYPSVNGQFCSENIHLLKEILRAQWGFKGFVQSDYTGTHSAVGGAAAGLDLSMKADHYGAEMKAAVLDGQVKESAVDEMVIRRFTQMFRFGMFNGPHTPTTIPSENDGAISRIIAQQCVVLLKNDDLLPLNADRMHTIAVIGPYAGAAHTGGGGSSMVKPLYTVSPVDGVKQHVGPDVNVVFNDGADLKAAAGVAKNADVVLVMVGNKDSEGKDRPNLLLPGAQNALVAAITKANPKTIVVLKTGGPVLMPWLSDVAAVLEAWYPGEEDGNVVADVVFGEVNPSGKLPMTFPQAENQVPASTPRQYPGVNGTAIYSEKLLIGYRWYDATDTHPLFPFGFGLSYTTFDFAHLNATKQSVSVDITNSGTHVGADVVQVYVAAPAAAGEPPKQLKGFAKVWLEPCQTRRVKIAIDPRAYSVWDVETSKWKVVPGKYTILVGDSSRHLPLSAEITIHPENE